MGSGGDTGRQGIIIHPRDVPKDSSGVPKIRGHYNPFDAERECGIRDDKGDIFVMFFNYLRKL